MVRRLFLAALLGLAAVARLTAQEAVTIKLKKAGKGDTVQIEQRATEESTTQFLDPNGKEVPTKQGETPQKRVKLLVWRESILDADSASKRAKRLERAYEKARITVGANTETLPLEGKTVLIEKQKDGKYTFRAKGGEELKADVVQTLADEFNGQASDEFDMRKAFPPTKAVKPGDSWDVDPAPLVRDFSGGLMIDGAKAKATGKLLGVRKEEGRTFGKMEFQVDLPLKGFVTPSGQSFAVDDGAKMSMTFNMDACIDGSAETGVLKSTITMSATSMTTTKEGMKLKMVLNSKVSAHERRTDAPAK
jgi:hypothetical protein